MRNNDASAFLYDQLIKLGDLMGDGEHLQIGGEWIEREYNQTLKSLGLHKCLPKTKSQYFKQIKV